MVVQVMTQFRTVISVCIKGAVICGFLGMICLGTACSSASSESIASPSVSLEGIVASATNIPVAQTFDLNFSSAVATSTVTTGSVFILEHAESTAGIEDCDVDLAIDAVVTCSSTTSCTLNPSSNLDFETKYILCITSDLTFVSRAFNGALIAFTTTGNVTEETVVTDATRPTVTLTSSDATLVTSNTFTITVTFSEVVDGFTLSDISVTNGTAGNLAETTTGRIFTASITPASDPSTVGVNVAQNVATDASENGNTASNSFSIRYDTTPLTVAMSTLVDSTTNDTPIDIFVTFSEAVSGFALNDVTVTNGTAADIGTGNDTAFFFTVTPTTDGVVTVALPAQKATDAVSGAKSNSAATSISLTYDGTAPTISSITPGDFTIEQDRGTDIVLVFSETISTASVTTNTANTTCSGSIQVSKDSFSTCVQMTAAPVASNNDKTYTLTPNADLDDFTMYKVRVTTSVLDLVTNGISSTQTQATGFFISSNGNSPF